MNKIAIFGAGAFGTALAIMYSKFCDNIALYSCFEDHVQRMRDKGVNEFLPEFNLPDNVEVCWLHDDMRDKIDASHIFWVFPVKITREILRQFRHVMHSNIIICSKGILDDGTYLVDLFENELPDSKVFYLAGPNFATDIASLKVSCANIGARNMSDAEQIVKSLCTSVLRLYPTDDVLGMQIASSIKNVVAIACGIVSGLDLGYDAHAALITIGLREMMYLGEQLGCKSDTFYSFCGIGDMILTASSELSRNMRLGRSLIGGVSMSELKGNGTYEGYNTIPQLLNIASQYSVKMPVCEIVHDIIHGKCDAKEIVRIFNRIVTIL